MIWIEEGSGLIPGGMKKGGKTRKNPPDIFQKGMITIEEGSGLIPNNPILIQNPAGQICVGKTSKLGIDRPCLSFPIEKTCLSTSVKMSNPEHICTYCYGKQAESRLNFPTGIKSRKENYRIYTEEKFFWRQLQGWILLNENKTHFFRYFVVGDIPDEHFLMEANKLAMLFPKIPFWVPTLKAGYVKRFLESIEEEDIAENFLIRLSSPTVNEANPIDVPWKSMTYTEKPPKGAYRCPSSDQDDECRDCWACWNKKIKLIAYPLNLQERKGKPKAKRSEYQ